MQCPMCSSLMRDIELRRDMEVQFCFSCKGVWFDKNMSALYHELNADIPELDQVLPSAVSTDHLCTCCESELQEMKFSTRGDLKIKRCSGCEGIFLNKGDLTRMEELASAMQKESESSLIHLALKKLRERNYEIGAN